MSGYSPCNKVNDLPSSRCTDSGLVLLPHTWIYVPCGPRPRVTSFRETATSTSYGYTAAISVNEQAVGLIHGHGRDEVFYSSGNPGFGQEEMARFAAASRSHSGEALTAEWVLGQLVISHLLTRLTPVPPPPGSRLARPVEIVSSIPTPRPERPSLDDEHDRVGNIVALAGMVVLVGGADGTKPALVAAQLASYRAPGDHLWWQLWNPEVGGSAGYWRDLTARPASVPEGDPAEDYPW
ncbi:hypothetical protein [Cryptosporangium phraense]|uniref:Uncharacterized protein n=1 Tax=Cryptosporangium phraense TaxID=2593070 RepID=A0A545AN24_9ACTN|nr:hypothetical protein [Cryptosporangium phraense]TQS42739.1 hypothetical protein FL583_21995 [Cryptosporangium phraense]